VVVGHTAYLKKKRVWGVYLFARCTRSIASVLVFLSNTSIKSNKNNEAL
jgi:hypothetical protein